MHLSDRAKIWQLGKDRRSVPGCGAWLSKYFRCAICLELQLVSYFSPKERWSVLSGRWQAEARKIGELDESQIQFKSNLPKPQPEYKACQRPQSNSWALHPIACLDMFERKKKEGGGEGVWSFQTCLIICSGGCLICHTNTDNTGRWILYVGSQGISCALAQMWLVSALEEFIQLIH